MNDQNKLDLLKQSFRLLVKKLNEKDRVAIVVYAGASGVVLTSTPGNQQSSIFSALNQLQASGSTHGAAGIELAYQIADEAFIQDGINRVILATDGDFNVDPSSVREIEFNPQLVSEYRLIGYENRVLKHEDFNNDKIDAGDIGAGHTVTDLYELTLVGHNRQSTYHPYVIPQSKTRS